MKKINILAAFLLINLTYLYPQELDTTKWFPYDTGDMWEYYVYDFNTLYDTLQIINIKDSVLEDGKISLTQKRQVIEYYPSYNLIYFTIDTTLGEVYGFNGIVDSVKLYKFDAKKGEQWVMYIHNPGYEIARVVDKYDDVIFGYDTKFMTMSYFAAEDSTDTTGLDRYGAIITKGFGPIQFTETDIQLYLKGAVIDGVLYGDTTDIITSVESNNLFLPKNIELLNNYPNPFNPNTTIPFKLNKRASISIIVYNSLGKEIRRLINNRTYFPGKHRVTWDGKDNNGRKAASGNYFYALISNNQRLTRSMILLK